MYVVDPQAFRNALHARGYRSIGALAKALGIHRNTIQHYLAGNGVFPANFEKMIRSLNIRPEELLTDRGEATYSPIAPIAPLIDQLHLEYPDVTFVCFGSRSRGRSRKYSDWDIGVFARGGLPLPRYMEMRRRAEELADPSPYLVDLVSLNRADAAFLKAASPHWIFLTGQHQDWIALNRKAAA